MKKQSGFTLIELVIVIILLGILSATAVPKFVDIKSDVYKANVQAMAGAINSANTLVYSKATIESPEDIPILDASVLEPEYTGATLIYGKMQSDSTTLNMFVAGLDDEEPWPPIRDGIGINMRIHPAGPPTIDGGGNCYVRYSQQWSRSGPLETTYPAKTTLFIDNC